MSSQKEYDRFMANLQTKIKAEEIGMKSWGSSRPTPKQLSRPTVDYFLNSATKLDNEQKKQNQMLEQYLDSQKTPIVRIGRDGRPHEYKYHAIPAPVLEDAEIINFDGSRINIPVIQNVDTVVGYDADGNPIQQQRPKEVLKNEILNKYESEIKNDLDAVETDINNNMVEITAYEKELENETNKINKLREDKNQMMQNVYNDRDLFNNNINEEIKNTKSKKEISRLGKEKSQRRKADAITLKKIDSDIKQQIYEHELNIIHIRNSLRILRDNLNVLQAIKENFTDNFTENKARILDTIKRNDEKLRIYQNELSSLNSGMLSTERQPNEDDVAYINRMELLGDTPFADNRNLFKSEMQNKQTLRENLLTVTRNKAIIDSVVNSLASQNDSSLIFFVNQSFEGIKNDILKRFGRDNENIKPVDILEYIGKYLHKVDPRNYQVALRNDFTDDASSLSESFAVYPQDIGDTIDYSNYDEDEEIEIPLSNNPLASASLNPALQSPNINSPVINIRVGGPLEDRHLELTNLYNDKKIYIKLKNMGTLKNPKIKPFLSETNAKGSYVEKNYASNDAEHSLKLKSAEFLEIDPLALNKIIPDKDSTQNYLLNIPQFYDTEAEILGNNPKLKANGEPYKDATISYGLGLHMHSDPKTIPEYINFGDKQLLLKKLFLSNILSIINKHHKKVNGFNNVKVSDTFVEIIYDIIHNKNYQSKLNKINENEKSIFDHLLKVCNLHKQLVGAGIVSLDKLKKDLEILEGEIQAGNNNHILKKKLYDLLQKMVHYNLISAPQSIKHFKQYETFFK
jgi:hypothetical protein